MIALDTNVLVRFLVEDDKAQSARAVRFFERAVESAEQLFVADVVLCEVVWVLRFGYEVPRTAAAAALEQLLQTSQLTFGDVDALRNALAAFKTGKGDFADYLIREHARSSGCETVVTFDRALLKEEGFVSP
jgi:predicted nucleic-acid-binding protein